MNVKKYFIAGLSIVLLCVASSFCPAYAQGNQAPDIAMLKLAQAYNDGKVELTEEEIAAIKVEAAVAIADALENIKQLGISERGITKYLPKNLATILSNVVSVSKQNISNEEKFSALVRTYGSNCQSYLVTWLSIYLVSIALGSFLILIPFIGTVISALVGLASTIFFWATVLCYLGII